MNAEQEKEYVSKFSRLWLQGWLMHLRKLRGALTFLHTKGGLSARYTNVEPAPDPDRYSFEHFVRVLDGICVYTDDEEEFVTLGSEMLREFYRFSKEHGKQFREQHKRGKQPHNYKHL